MVNESSPQIENGYTKIANELLEALAMYRIPGEAFQMLNVIIRKTYGFNKKQDTISTSQFVMSTKLSKPAIHRARKRLLEMNLITVHKKTYTNILTYSIQKNYKKWKVYTKKSTVHKNVFDGTQKSTVVYPKTYTKGTPKRDTQKKERQYTKETLTKERTNVQEYTIEFEEFWVRYKKKGNKITSFKKWSELTEFDKIDVMAIVNKYVASTNRTFLKDGQRYLNKKFRYWEDEIQTSEKSGKSGGVSDDYIYHRIQKAKERDEMRNDEK